MSTFRAVLLVVGALLPVGVGCESKGSGDKGPAPPPVIAEPPDPELTGPDVFEELAKSAGIDFAFRNGEDTSPHLSILESLGGGVALIDYDRDGLLDVYIPGGGFFDGPDKKQIKGYPGRLYQNLGSWKFRDVTGEAGLDSLAGGQPWFYTHAAAVADYDRDGWADLLVTGWGRVALFRNVPGETGGRRFSDTTTAAGLDKGVTWATSSAFADLDGDGWADLYVCEYVNWSFANHPKCEYDGKTPDVCPPKKFSGLQHKLYRNDTRGRFADVTAEVGLHTGGPDASKGLGVLVVDVNLDGKPDVYVANDTVDNFLYVNQSTPGTIRLQEKGLSVFVARDGNGSPNGSMGLDAGDPAGTGLPYLWVTNYENELHALYRNESTRDRLRFQFYTPASGIAAIGQKYVGWGTGFVDYDHDGREDLLIANGHAIRYPKTADRRQKPVLFRNLGGRFKDLTPRGGPYFREPHLARGVALGDLDNDGKVDAVVSHMNEPVAVLRNVADAKNHWLGVGLEGKGQADVIGARVIVEAGGRKQTRFAKGGGSYASAPDRRFVFGLGTADRIDKLTVVWPDGQKQEWANPPTDRYHVIAQGEPNLRSPAGKK